MSTVGAASSMSMASLYAMLGLAMPSGASGAVGSSPALAMISASNQAVATQVGTLMAGMSGGAAATGGTDLSTALLGLANLDPTAELERLQSALGNELEMAAETDANG